MSQQFKVIMRRRPLRLAVIPDGPKGRSGIHNPETVHIARFEFMDPGSRASRSAGMTG